MSAMVLRRSTVLLVAAALSPASASGAGLQFTNAQPLDLSWSQLGGGAAAPTPRAQLELCNRSGKRLTPIAVRPVGFGFTGANVTSDASVLAVTSDQLSLGGDSCTTVRLSARVPPKAGVTYDGVIVASAPGGNLARFRLRVSGPETPSEVAPEAAADPQALAATRKVPGGDAEFGDHTDLLVVDPGDPGPALPAHGPLGIVTAGSDTATVYADGDADSNGNGALRLPIRIAGADRAATYSGKLTLTGVEHRGDKDAPNVTVSIVVQDHVFWAILAIIIGLLLPFGTAALLRRILPIGLLEDDRDHALDEYDAAEASFKARWGGTFPGYAAPDPDQRARFVGEIAADIKEAKKAGLMLDLDGETWKAARKAVADARADATVFGGGGHDDLGPTLMRLDAALDAAEHAGAGFFADNARRPPFFADGRALLQGGSLPVGGAGVALEKVKAATALAERWTDLVERAGAAWRWLMHFPLDDPDVQTWIKRLDEAAWLLLQTDDADQLREQAIARRLDRIERNLLRLATANGWWRPGDPEPEAEVMVGVLPFDQEGRHDAGFDPDQLSEGELRDRWLSLVPAHSRVHAKQASLLALQLLVLTVALALGILAGLREVYFGKSFGTLDDYLALILLGSVSAVVTPFIANAAKGLRAAGSRLPFLS
jgi:hypothetical protein